MGELRAFVSNQKTPSIILFLSISVSALVITNSTTPAGPWSGLLVSFPWFWLFGFAAAVALVWGSSVATGRTRVLLIAAIPLFAVLIMLPTIKWGVPYGVRDPWLHLGMSKRVELANNPYPFLHLLLGVASAATGMPIIDLLSGVQLIAPAIAALILLAVARRIDFNGALLAAASLAPVVHMWGVSRPFAVVPIFVLGLWLLLLLGRSRPLIMLSPVLLAAAIWWHPVAMVLYLIILFTLLAVRRAGALGSVLSPYFGTESDAVPRPSFLFMFGAILLVFYLLFYTRLFDFTVVQGLLASGQAPVEHPSLVGRLPDRVVSFARRSILVLILGVAGGLSALVSINRHRLNRIQATSLLSTIPLAAIFVVIDLLQVPGFGTRRVLQLLPLVLVPAGIYTFKSLDVRWSRIAFATLVLTSGIAITHESPLTTGGSETSATKSDVVSVGWLHDHRGDAPVVGSETTLHIVDGVYGETALFDWTGDNPWHYQTIKRDARFPWDVEIRRPGTYVVVSQQAKLEAHSNTEYNSFTRTTPRVYSNGNVWIQLASPRSGSV